MKFFSKSKTIILLIATLGITACQNPPTTAVNGNQTNISNVPVVGNVNITTNSNSANSNVLPRENVGIEATEPDQYQAMVTLKLETGGAQKTTVFPPLVSQVARSGDNRRMEFTLPGGEKIIFLDRGGQQFVISPQRKQYAELNKEALGVNLRRLLMPEQIVKQLKNIKGVERIGEEKFAERNVIRYRYGATTQVNPPAANSSAPTNISTEAVVLVDKETGLPLRSETFVESQNTSVQGLKNLLLVTEIGNLQMKTDPSLFAEPTDYKKVAPEEIRGQIELIFKALGVFLQQMMNSQEKNNQPPTVTSPTPAAKP